jgi:outer membrane protein OmpA-like peptidoglycan-associated protein
MVLKLNRKMYQKSILMLVLVCSSLCGTQALAQDLLPRDNTIMKYHQSPAWRESESHPLRIIAYVMHPIGWLAREAVFRPISAFAASNETTRSVMGYRDPFDFRETVCFDGNEAIPDCRRVRPYTHIISADNTGSMGNNKLGMDQERQVFFPDVNFDFDKSNLNTLGKGRVLQIANMLSTVPEMQIVVEGHTDYKGSDEYNMRLGEQRAKAVIAELTSMGIAESRLSPISYGEGRPIFTEETDWARAANRRVQFTVEAAGEVTSELPPAR